MASDRVQQLVSDAIDLTGDDEDSIGGEQSGVPLPGLDPGVECSLCKLYTKETDNDRAPRNGDRAVDTVLLKELTKTFHQVKLMARPGLVRAYTERFRSLGRTHSNLSFLVDVTEDEVRRHYDEDHDECADQFRDPKKKIQRVLEGVMNLMPDTLCVELNKGENKGKRVVHPQRLRAFLETVKVYETLCSKNPK